MPKPLLEFDAEAWRSDPELSLCPVEARGVWFELLIVMHLRGRVGELSGTAEELASLARCVPAEVTRALTVLQTTGAAIVAERNGVVTVVNRRMNREYKLREATRLRDDRYRKRPPCNAECNGEVTNPLKVQGSGFKAAQAPLTAEPLKGARSVPNGAETSGFNGSRRYQAEFSDGWDPESEADYMALLNELAENMENWGGKWRNRWRKEPDKCLRVLREFRSDGKQKIIAAPGGYMDDLWKRMA